MSIEKKLRGLGRGFMKGRKEGEVIVYRKNNKTLLSNSDGSNPIEISDKVAIQWSPDGRELLLLEEEFQKERYFLLDIFSEEEKEILPYNESKSSLLITPDNKNFLFKERRWYNLIGGKRDLKLANKSNFEIEKLVKDCHQDYKIFISPDSKKIAYTPLPQRESPVQGDFVVYDTVGKQKIHSEHSLLLGWHSNESLLIVEPGSVDTFLIRDLKNIKRRNVLKLETRGIKTGAPVYSPDKSKICCYIVRANENDKIHGGTGSFDVYSRSGKKLFSHKLKLINGRPVMGISWASDNKRFVITDHMDYRNTELVSINYKTKEKSRIAENVSNPLWQPK